MIFPSFKTLTLFPLLVLIAGPAAAESNIKGFREAVITTARPEAWETFFLEDAGWERRYADVADGALKELWRLPAEARIREALYANPGTDRGFVRVVTLEGVPQAQIRSNDQPWDTGGHFDFNLRVAGLEALSVRLMARGWQAASDPVQFTFGPFEVKEWIVRGPDGVRLALIERVAPPLKGWPHLKITSRVFNATQTVRDMPASLAFYRDVLKFETYLEHRGPSREPGPNVLGLPHNLAAEIPRHVFILHPVGINDGSVELLAFDGATGRDFGAHATPDNLGVSALRFPVDDLDAVLSRLRSAGLTPETGPMVLGLAPYGAVRIFAIRAPEGAWLEFFEPQPGRSR